MRYHNHCGRPGTAPDVPALSAPLLSTASQGPPKQRTGEVASWSYGDNGQVTALIAFAVSAVLIGLLAFAADMSNLWFHRQTAQDAADAACGAGAMDMLYTVQGTPMGGFTMGSNFDCASLPTAAPCKYAALNGYRSPGLTAGQASNDVSISFLSSIAGVQGAPRAIAGDFPFMQVDVADRVPVFFAGLVTGSRYQDVHAVARCGLVLPPGPGPIMVLNPTCGHALEVSGSATVAVVGGPVRGIVVNSNNSGCAAATTGGAGCTGGGTIDLSKGGPDFTGSDFAVAGAPTIAPSGFNGGTTGQWVSPGSPMLDPFKLAAPPAVPLPPSQPPDPYPSQCQNQANPCNVAYGTNGCPDPLGCVEYGPGLYTSAISVKNQTAIFDPGVYYITGTTSGNASAPGTGCVPGPSGSGRYGLYASSGGTLRPSTAVGDGSHGTMFYLSGNGPGTYGSVFFGSNSGKSTGIDPFPSSQVPCPGGPAPNPPLPPTLVGNILLAPCTGPYGDPSGQNRGMLMFQDRNNADPNGQPSMQGGGGLLLGGNLYFHNCPNSTTAPCANTDYNAFLNLQGTSGSTTYVYGDIISDELVLGGNGQVTMQLDPKAMFYIPKVSLLQ